MIWRSGSGIGHINKVNLHRTWLVLGLVTTFSWSTIPVFILATQLGHRFVGRRCNGDGFSHRWQRNGKLCVAVRPGLLTYWLKSVDGTGC